MPAVEPASCQVGVNAADLREDALAEVAAVARVLLEAEQVGGPVSKTGIDKVRT